ncbi:Elongation factor G [subsurface metagenome]
MSTSIDSIRNIVITGHGGTGKTSFVEQILFNGGKIPKPEQVESGKTVSDFTDEEINRKISIHTALSHLEWQNKKINIFDTPGSTDFMGEVLAALRVSESAMVLVGADVGVQIGTIEIWRRLKRNKIPRMVFINKMEKENADFSKALNDLKDKFQENFIPLVIPIGAGAGFKGIVDLSNQKAYIHQGEGKAPIEAGLPGEMADRIEEYRQALIEAAAEGDDALIEKFFETEELDSEEIGLGLTKRLKEAVVVPVLCGSALLNSGIIPCLNTVASICPSPPGRTETLVSATAGKEATKTVDYAGTVSSFVFKTSIDQFSGKLSFIKVIAGAISSDIELLNTRERKKEKIGKVYTCLGKRLEETDSLCAGDIGILAKLSSAITNDTLCSPDEDIHYESLRLPQPVHALAISAASKKDEDKLNQLLQRAAEEDLTFRVAYNKETRETVISGMGELQLDIILDKIKTQSRIEVKTKIPKIAYRETLTTSSGAEYQHKKQSGGHGQYARVTLEIKPLPRGEHFNFVNAIVGGRISKGYIPGVEKGVLEGMESGILAGYPVVDLEAKVVDGKEHSVDSSELAFRLAARGALKAALEKAKPVLVEPIMNLRVLVDNQYLGDVLSDLSSRRSKVLGQAPLGGGIQEIKALVPQSELLRYSIDLRSITSGTASFEMEFAHYNPISGKVAEEVIKKKL